LPHFTITKVYVVPVYIVSFLTRYLADKGWERQLFAETRLGTHQRGETEGGRGGNPSAGWWVDEDRAEKP